MRFLGLVMGGVLGIVQGYALIPFCELVARLSPTLGYRLFISSVREVKRDSPVALLFVVIGLLVGTALYWMPLVLIAVLQPEFRHTAYLPSWCWMFGAGMFVYRLKAERQKR